MTDIPSTGRANDPRVARILQMVRFVVVGGLGFTTDAGLLVLLSSFTPLGPGWSRFISFPIALLVTWSVNRSWTFDGPKIYRTSVELVMYFGIQIIGFVVNWTLYMAFVLRWIPLDMAPVFALALASIASAFVTYTLMTFGLYRHKSQSRVNRHE